MRQRRGQGLLWTLGIVILLGLGELALRARYRQHTLSAAEAKLTGITIVALGDSITAGWPGSPAQAWPARLQTRLHAEYPAVAWHIVNAGAPGNTAPMGYVRFNQEVAAYGPDLVLIAFGLNDCHRARHALDRWFEARVPVGPERSYLWRSMQARVVRIGRQVGRPEMPAYAPEPRPMPFFRTSPAGFSAALSALIDQARDIRSRSVLLTMTPLAEGTPPDVRAIFGECAAYNMRIRAMAEKRGIPLVDLADPMSIDAFAADGLHLTSVGQQWAADRVFSVLEAAGLWAALARRA